MARMARPSGLVNPEGWDDGYFQWGTTTLTNITPGMDIGAGVSTLNVSSFVLNVCVSDIPISGSGFECLGHSIWGGRLLEPNCPNQPLLLSGSKTNITLPPRHLHHHHLQRCGQLRKRVRFRLYWRHLRLLTQAILRPRPTPLLLPTGAKLTLPSGRATAANNNGGGGGGGGTFVVQGSTPLVHRRQRQRRRPTATRRLVTSALTAAAGALLLHPRGLRQRRHGRRRRR